MAARVAAICVVDDKAEREDMILNTREVLEGYANLEKTSLLELALWKFEMSLASNEASAADGSDVDREVARTTCGASFVLPNIVIFLEIIGD